MAEDRETRIRRLRMRSMRRGIREMDLILGQFAEAGLGDLRGAELEAYEALLGENDHDLYQWVTGQSRPPERFAGLVAQIADLAGRAMRPL